MKQAEDIFNNYFNDVTVRDYSILPKYSNCEETNNRISVLGYDGDLDISASICYIPNSLGSYDVRFQIGIDQFSRLDSQWRSAEIDEYTFPFFEEILQKLIINTKSLGENVHQFSSKSWIKRNKKLSQII